MLCAGIKTQKSALLSDEYDHFELSLRKRDVHRSSVSFHDFLYRRNTDSVENAVSALSVIKRSLRILIRLHFEFTIS